MSAVVKGWCPSLLRPMQAADGWLTRLMPPRGLLAASAARRIAEAAETLGNGQLELTQRAGLQVRGLQDSGLEALADLALELGLAVEDPAIEARRSIIASPLIGADPSVSPACEAHLSALDRAIFERPAFAGLPEKFGFVVDGGGLLPLRGIGSDLVLRCELNRIELGRLASVTLPAGSDLAAAAIALAETFVRLNAGRFRRLRAYLDAEGPAALPRTAGLTAAAAVFEQKQAAAPRPGLHCLPDSDVGAFLAVWPFGALTAERLWASADLAEHRGDGALRITPWRALAVAGVDRSVQQPLAEAFVALGAVTSPHAFLRIDACPGKGACAEASVDTRGLASALAAKLPAQGGHLHLSGCSKGCAHPRAAALTLVGEDGGWALVRDGRADAQPSRHGLGDREILDLAHHA